MQSICVFAGSSRGRPASFRTAARALGEAIAGSGRALVYGGTSVGLMGDCADAALARGGRVLGVLPSVLADREIAHHGLTELRIVASMQERKAEMARESDAFVALPGGYGTLDELFEMLTSAQVGLQQKPCGLVDVDGYFSSLLAFVDRAERDGLVRPEHRALLHSDADPARLLDRLAAYVPRNVAKWDLPPID